MNCGLGNLDTLKRHLIAGTLQGDPRFDAALQAVGLAVAGAFEAFCNRRFGYVAGDTIVVTGGRSYLYLPRYPIWSVATVKTRSEATEAWATESGQPAMVNYETGLIEFGAEFGDDLTKVQITWTGGYWFDTKEPEEAGYPTSKPSAGASTYGAAAAEVPDALRGAWLMQCEAAWSARDKLGAGLVDKPAPAAEVKLSQAVEQILRGYIRY